LIKTYRPTKTKAKPKSDFNPTKISQNTIVQATFNSHLMAQEMLNAANPLEKEQLESRYRINFFSVGASAMKIFWAFDVSAMRLEKLLLQLLLQLHAAHQLQLPHTFKVKTKTGNKCIRNWFELIGNEKTNCKTPNSLEGKGYSVPSYLFCNDILLIQYLLDLKLLYRSAAISFTEKSKIIY
jgi:hypothetical protein